MPYDIYKFFAQECVVQLQAEFVGRIETGTGFFVAPQILLTCRHVVKDDRSGNCAVKITVYWKGQVFEAIIHHFENEKIAISDKHDIAILKLLDISIEHSCVYLDTDFYPGDELYTFGYPKKLRGQEQEGASLRAICEGIEGQGQLFTFSASGTRSGFSGAPLLNTRTGRVCGLVKSERSSQIDNDGERPKLRIVAGGNAISMTTIFSEWTNLQELNYQYHQQNIKWNNIFLQSKQSLFTQKKLSNNFSQDWGDAPDVQFLYGRSKELSKLQRWILNDRCRLVAIVGMAGIGKTQATVRLGRGGIGKTDLSLKLAKGIQNEFEFVFWRSLLNAPKVSEILSDLVKVLSNQRDIDLPSTVDKQIQRLLYYLENYRCLLILDNFDTVMQIDGEPGQYVVGYEDYGQLIQRVGEVSHASCLLLTSREKPKEVERLAGEKKPVRFFDLQGLGYSSTKKIFKTIGSGFHGSERDWQELNEFLKGNPLALEIAARHIQSVFSGNISAFLNQDQRVFKEIRERLLDWYFERLSEREKEVLFWLAINREPMSISELQNDVISVNSKQQIPSTLQLIQRCLPLEKSIKTDGGVERFTLQPVLLEDTTKRLIEQVVREIEINEIKIFNEFCLLKASAKDYVVQTQIKLIVKPIWEKLVYIFGNQGNVENQLRKILLNWQEKASLRLGYLAGNILNLLGQMQVNLSGYDFSNLTICQARLQDLKLYGVNFAGSNLSGSTFTQSFSSVLSVAFNPQKDLLALSTASGKIRLINTADYQLVATFEGHSDWVRSVAFSPDGSLLASSSDDQTIKLWNVDTGYQIKTLRGHTDWVWSVAFSPDGLHLASSSGDHTIKIWNVVTKEYINTLTGHTNGVVSVTFSNNGLFLASGSDDNTIKIWDINTEQCITTLEGHSDDVQSVAFSPNDSILVSTSGDHTVKVWDVDTKQCIATFYEHTQRVKKVVFHPHEMLFASCSDDRTVRLWSINEKRCYMTFQDHRSSVNSITFNYNGSVLACGCDDNTVKLWDTKSSQCIKTIHGYTNWIWSLAFNSDGTILASGHGDCLVRLWNISTGEFLKEFKGHENVVVSVSFNPNSDTLASGSDDYKVHLWNITNGQCIRTLGGHQRGVKAVPFSPDGSLLATSSGDHTIKLWNSSTGELIETLQGHTSQVWSVTFSPNGSLLASSSSDYTIKLWDVSTTHCLKTLKGHTFQVWSVAFSPDGSLLASGSDDKTIKLWDVGTGQCLRTLEGHSDWIWSVAFSPDGLSVASGGGDNTVKLWDVGTGQCLRTLEGHSDWIWSVAFSPDGLSVASGSSDGTIRVWNIDTGKSQRTLRAWRPYEGMNINEIKGLPEVQKEMLKTLGAIE